MWAQRPARSLPGALWRLYALREWVRTDADRAATDFAVGQGVALERAGAFCRVVVAGRVRRADEVEAGDPLEASALTRSSASLHDTADDLEAAAALWRTSDLV